MRRTKLWLLSPLSKRRNIKPKKMPKSSFKRNRMTNKSSMKLLPLPLSKLLILLILSFGLLTLSTMLTNSCKMFNDEICCFKTLLLLLVCFTSNWKGWNFSRYLFLNKIRIISFNLLLNYNFGSIKILYRSVFSLWNRKSYSLRLVQK